MAIRPAKHKLPTIKAPSHAREVYDRQTRRMTAGLKTAADVRNSSFWKKVSATYRQRHPLCENPHGWHNEFGERAVEVHHKISIQEAPHLAYTHSNLMALCRICHAKFSQEERKK